MEMMNMNQKENDEGKTLKIKQIKLWLGLLKPPCVRFTDKILYLLLCLITAVTVVFVSILKRKWIKGAIPDIYLTLMPKDFEINFHDVKFIARKGKMDMLVCSNVAEPWLTSHFKPREGDVVIDVGAHIGKYALIAAKMVGENGLVIAIEAHQENYSALLRNIELNGFGNIRAFNFAALERDDEWVRLGGSRDDGYSVKVNSYSTNFLSVRSKSIDTISREEQIPRVDIMKIDVEGAEVEVLKGARETLLNSPSLKVLIEVRYDNIAEVNSIMSKCGFNKCEVLLERKNILSERYYIKNERDDDENEVQR
jgi:FkbM family methyltransferase